jgi:hypothetical protein
MSARDVGNNASMERFYSSLELRLGNLENRCKGLEFIAKVQQDLIDVLQEEMAAVFSRLQHKESE